MPSSFAHLNLYLAFLSPCHLVNATCSCMSRWPRPRTTRHRPSLPADTFTVLPELGHARRRPTQPKTSEENIRGERARVLLDRSGSGGRVHEQQKWQVATTRRPSGAAMGLGRRTQKHRPKMRFLTLGRKYFYDFLM